ncbi:MAG: rod shape-determining protein MreC, partial [Proteobacteria bacterium]|nr:rod shape-determining protein MreC [Pseudomonadota bacterium]
PTHAMPVRIERNGLRTIAVGTGDASRFALPYLPRNADVQVDDLLVSSGLGGVFPAGLPVGRITEVRRDPSLPLAIVNATPAAALDRDREILLLWYRPRVPLPANEPPAASPRDTTAPTKAKERSP